MSSDLLPSLRTTLAALAALRSVRVRPLFGSDAWFAGPVMFAFVAAEGLVVRLPDGPRGDALEEGTARPWLGALPSGLSGWVVVTDPGSAERLLRAAHASASAMARGVARQKSTRRPIRPGRSRED